MFKVYEFLLKCTTCFLMLNLAGALPAFAHAMENTPYSLQDLDKVLSQRKEYMACKEQKIAAKKDLLNKSVLAEEKVRMQKAIFKLYLNYQLDSALVYAEQMLDLSETILRRQSIYKAEALLSIARVHTHTGKFANDFYDGTSYFELDPANNWTPIERTVTYPNGGPPSSSYLYRLVYNTADNHLYGVIGHATGPIVKINPSTQVGEIVFNYGAHPSWYNLAIDSSNKMYTIINSQAIGYGLYEMGLNNVSAGFSKLSSSAAPAATPTTLNDGPLQHAGFARSWQSDFGPDDNLYVSDEVNHVVRKIDLVNKTVETVVGLASTTGGMVDGKKDKARLNAPRGIAWNKDGTTLYISDYGNNRIRKWTLD